MLLIATAFMLLVTAAAAWRWPRDAAAALGAVVAFAALLLTSYYWVMLLLLPIGRGRWLPTAGWLGINLGLWGLHLATPAFEMIYGLMSWALLGLFLAWLGPDAVRTMWGFARGEKLEDVA